MNIGIIGAGFTGLSAAYRLSKEHTVTVFELDEKPGGLAIGYKENVWDWTLEKHYHHWFTNDDAVLSLAKEIGHDVIITRPKTSSLIESDIVQLDSPLTLLLFNKLSLLQRLQMAAALGFLKIDPFWKPLEKFKASDILPSAIGKKGYEMLWEPLLVNKFGSFAKDISLAWFWARIKKRTTALAYPSGGFLRFAEHLAEHVEKQNGTILYHTQVTAISSTKSGVSLAYKKEGGSLRKKQFDRVIVTLPGFHFLNIAPDLPESYKKQLLSLKGLGAVNIVVRLKQQFFPDNTYWLNVCEKNAPVLAIVEHTNFMDKKHYNNEHLLYLGNYLSMDHPYVQAPKETILKHMMPFLKKLNPTFEASVISYEKFTAPFAQPIIPINYSRMIPPFETPIPHVYLANMQQVYPWDRGTNYAVELGEKVATRITAE